MKMMDGVGHGAKNPVEIQEIDGPDPAQDEALVRIGAVGICHTDIASRDGILGSPFPSVFGHEGAGVVERVGDCVTKVKAGDHVVLAPASDGSCEQCQAGAPMYCDRFNELNLQAGRNLRTASLSGGNHAFLKYFGQSSFSHLSLSNEPDA